MEKVCKGLLSWAQAVEAQFLAQNYGLNTGLGRDL